MAPSRFRICGVWGLQGLEVSGLRGFPLPLLRICFFWSWTKRYFTSDVSFSSVLGRATFYQRSSPVLSHGSGFLGLRGFGHSGFRCFVHCFGSSGFRSTAECCIVVHGLPSFWVAPSGSWTFGVWGLRVLASELGGFSTFAELRVRRCIGFPSHTWTPVAVHRPFTSSPPLLVQYCVCRRRLPHGHACTLTLVRVPLALLSSLYLLLLASRSACAG